MLKCLSGLNHSCLASNNEICNTERFDYLDKAKKERMLKNTAEVLTLKGVRSPEDMSEDIIM